MKSRRRLHHAGPSLIALDAMIACPSSNTAGRDLMRIPANSKFVSSNLVAFVRATACGRRFLERASLGSKDAKPTRAISSACG